MNYFKSSSEHYNSLYPHNKKDTMIHNDKMDNASNITPETQIIIVVKKKEDDDQIEIYRIKNIMENRTRRVEC